MTVQLVFPRQNGQQMSRFTKPTKKGGDISHETIHSTSSLYGKSNRYRIVIFPNMGLSENSVPLNPMVNDHYPY